jgi:hypothetical protein
MPLNVSPVPSATVCEGHEWGITDENRLAALVADLLLGRHRHVSKILRELEVPEVRSSNQQIDDLVELLIDVPDIYLPHTLQDKRYARDGWLFQMISWIAIRKMNPDALTAIPHTQPTAKGFDNLIVEVENGHLVGVIVGEDKATENPRSTVRDLVWPEIKEMEDGHSDSALMGQVTAIVERGGYGDEVDGMLKQVFWGKVRKYRVAVAGPITTHNRVFKGFHIKAPGGVSRRKGEVLNLDELREWFDEFAQKVIVALEAQRQVDV